VLDISESGRQIGEKLFALLDASQQQELMQYVLAQKQGGSPDTSLHSISPQIIPTIPIARLTEVQAEGLYFCLENRLVLLLYLKIGKSLVMEKAGHEMGMMLQFPHE